MSLNEMFELIVVKVGSFLAIELTACEGNVLVQVCCRRVNIFLTISISHILGKLCRNLVYILFM